MAGAKTVSTEKQKGHIKRSLAGTTFLTFEHIAHLSLVLIVAGLVGVGAIELLQAWAGNSASWLSGISSLGASMMPAPSTTPMNAVYLAAALLVLTPLMLVLGMRTRAEWAKRQGYTARLAYKAPIYTALGVAAAIAVCSLIAMVSAALTAVAIIGMQSINFATMFINNFAPALLMFAIFIAVKWYIYMLAKGKDMGRQFNALLGAAALIVAAVLFVSSIAALRDTSLQIVPSSPCYKGLCDGTNYNTLFKY